MFAVGTDREAKTHFATFVGGIGNIIRVHMAHLRQECHNSKI